ncbi:hypothetical protein ACWC6I_17310 [Streptomyces sp. NPDC001414]
MRWGRKLVSATPVGDGRHRVAFADGTSAVSDVLVGAEGVWSKVRALVSDARPVYSGMSYVDTCLHDVDTAHPRAAGLVGNGALYALASVRAAAGAAPGLTAWHRRTPSRTAGPVQRGVPKSWVQ